MKHIYYGLFALMLLLTGCGNAGTDNLTGLGLPDGANAILSTRTVALSAPTALTIDTGTSIIDFDVALIGLREIELETAESTDDGHEEFDLVGPFVIDLATETAQNCGTYNIDDDADDDGISDINDTDDDNDGVADSSDPDDDNDGVPDAEDSVMGDNEILDAMELIPGTYVEIEMKIDDVSAEDCPDLAASPIIGNAVYAEGTIDGTPFVYEHEFDVDFETQNPDGIVVDDGSIASFILSFDLSAWFAGIDFSEADVTDGVILIDNDHNTDIRDQIKANIEEAAELDSD